MSKNTNKNTQVPWQGRDEEEIRAKVAAKLKDEMSQPETYWWLSFCDPEKPKGAQFLGVNVVKAHGIADALTKSHALKINPGGEVYGTSIPETEETKKRLTPEVLNKLISLQDMIDLGWEPMCVLEGKITEDVEYFNERNPR